MGHQGSWQRMGSQEGTNNSRPSLPDSFALPPYQYSSSQGVSPAPQAMARHHSLLPLQLPGWGSSSSKRGGKQQGAMCTKKDGKKRGRGRKRLTSPCPPASSPHRHRLLAPELRMKTYGPAWQGSWISHLWRPWRTSPLAWSLRLEAACCPWGPSHFCLQGPTLPTWPHPERRSRGILAHHRCWPLSFPAALHLHLGHLAWKAAEGRRRRRSA